MVRTLQIGYAREMHVERRDQGCRLGKLETQFVTDSYPHDVSVLWSKRRLAPIETGLVQRRRGTVRYILASVKDAGGRTARKGGLHAAHGERLGGIRFRNESLMPKAFWRAGT